MNKVTNELNKRFSKKQNKTRNRIIKLCPKLYNINRKNVPVAIHTQKLAYEILSLKINPNLNKPVL